MFSATANDIAKLLIDRGETVSVAEFARAAAEKLDTTWGIAELGAAGPTGTPYGHGPGISVIGVWGPTTISTTIRTNDDNRQRNMLAFAEAGLALFKQALQSRQ